MLVLWKAEDFRLQESGFRGAKDHWEPRSNLAPGRETSKFDRASQNRDFWDPLPAPAVEHRLFHEREPAWFDDVELPQFEARAAENPFLLPRGSSPSETLSARRARWLLSLLDVPSSSTRRAFIRAFIELFEHFSHANTFRALSELALDDVSADEILTAFHLKLLWAEYPKFWSIRQSRLGPPFAPHNGQTMLTWSRAVRLARSAKGLPAECIIQEDWYDDWLLVPFGDPTFWSFMEYTSFRLDAFSAGALELPDELKRKDERGLPPPSFGGNSLDGVLLGSSSRTGQLVRLTTDVWGLSCLTKNNSEANAE